MKMALQIVGVAALIIGVLWMGQGLGLVRWPASSFMVDQRPWALGGAVLVLVGTASLWFSARR